MPVNAARGGPSGPHDGMTMHSVKLGGAGAMAYDRGEETIFGNGGMNDEPNSGCPLDMTRLLIMDFVRTLELEATRDGRLPVARVRALAEAFLEDYRKVSQTPIDHCLTLHEALRWDERRRHPFERLLIRRFAHLLPKREGDEGVREGAPLSRRLIPGFMVAVTKMIGIDHYTDCEARIGEAVDRMKAESPAPVDWSHLSAQAEVVAQIDQALADMAPYFDNLGKRLDWLTAVVNGHLGPPPPEDGERLWVMDRDSALLLLRALYGDTRRRLRDTPQLLEAHIGAEGMRALRHLHADLNRLEAEDPDLGPPLLTAPVGAEGTEGDDDG